MSQLDKSNGNGFGGVRSGGGEGGAPHLLGQYMLRQRMWWKKDVNHQCNFKDQRGAVFKIEKSDDALIFTKNVWK